MIQTRKKQQKSSCVIVSPGQNKFKVPIKNKVFLASALKKTGRTEEESVFEELR
jgi:hypothetical protein